MIKTKVKVSKKSAKKKVNIKWLDKPEPHDYVACESYLNLIFDQIKSKNIVGRLKNAEMTRFKAKDIFRASRLSLLGISNSHVKSNLKKINKGEKISPLLLVRNPNDSSVIIGDGYHRLCATYGYVSEDIIIPCKIV